MKKQNDMPELPTAPLLADYPHQMTDNIRFADLDIQNHVNNVAIATYFESGRIGFSHDPINGFQVPGARIALRRIEIDYLAEMKFPGQVIIATRVKRIGITSLALEHALFVGETCTATAISTIVLIDPASKRPMAFPAEIAAKLKAAAAL